MILQVWFGSGFLARLVTCPFCEFLLSIYCCPAAALSPIWHPLPLYQVFLWECRKKGMGQNSDDGSFNKKLTYWPSWLVPTTSWMAILPWLAHQLGQVAGSELRLQQLNFTKSCLVVKQYRPSAANMLYSQPLVTSWVELTFPWVDIPTTSN